MFGFTSCNFFHAVSIGTWKVENAARFLRENKLRPEKVAFPISGHGQLA